MQWTSCVPSKLIPALSCRSGDPCVLHSASSTVWMRGGWGLILPPGLLLRLRGCCQDFFTSIWLLNGLLMEEVEVDLPTNSFGWCPQ